MFFFFIIYKLNSTSLLYWQVTLSYMHKKLIPLYQYISFYVQRSIYLHNQQELS